MVKYALAFFFTVMYAGDDFGLNFSLAPGISGKNLILYTIFAAIAVNAAVARNRVFELRMVFLLFSALIAYAILTWIAVAFVIGDPEYAVRGSLIRIKSALVDQLLTFTLFFYGVTHKGDALRLLRVIVWIVVVGNIVTLIDSFDLPNLGIVESRVSDGRFFGFLGSANGYGIFLALFLPASVALFSTSKGKTRLVAGLGVFSTALALILTASRGAYLGSIAGSIGAAFLLRRHIPVTALVRVGVFASVAVVFLIALAFVVGYSDLLLDRFGRFEGNSHIATSGRSTIWARAIRAMIENPISFFTGFGYNAYESSRSFYAATHNQYLNNFYNLGVIGVGAFLGIFVLLLARIRSSLPVLSADTRPHVVAAMFGTCAFLVSIFFSEYHNVGYLLWAYLGVLMRVVVSQTRETYTVTSESKNGQVPAESWRVNAGAHVPNPSRST